MNLLKRMLTSIMTILISVYVLFAFYLYVYQDKIIFLPSQTIAATPDVYGLSYEDVYLVSKNNNRIHGWYVYHADPKGYLLLFHGNAGNVSNRQETLRVFNELELNVLIIDYQGYGLSEGIPSEKNTYDDAIAAWNYLTEDRNVAADKIVIFGRSLGGGVASWLATQKQAAAVILESTFTSTANVAKDIYPFMPVQLLTRTHYDNISRMQDIQAPILIIHSQDDRLIPFKHGQSLFESANQPKHFFKMQGDHNNGFLLNELKYKLSISEFLEKYL